MNKNIFQKRYKKKSSIRQLIIIILLAVFYSCSNKNTELITPNWEEGDYRIVEKNISFIFCLKQDTAINIVSKRIYKIDVVLKTNNFYIIEIKNISNPHFSYENSSDSIKKTFNKVFIQYSNLINKISTPPYQVKVSRAGEIIGIINWENFLDNYTNMIFEIYDSNNTRSYEETDLLKQNFKANSNNNFELELKEELLKDISDNLYIYNICLLKDSIIKKQSNIVNPLSKKPTTAFEEFRLISINNDTYEIKYNINFNNIIPKKNIKDIYNKRYNIDDIIQNINMHSNYYWNSYSTWIDSSNSFVGFKNDTIEVKMITNTILHQ